MNITLRNTLLIASCIIAGIFLYAITNDWIIFSLPHQISDPEQSEKLSIERKPMQLAFWHNKKWDRESIQMIWSNKTENNTKNLTNAWLNLLDEEGFMDKKVTVQSASLSHSKNEVYISFDQNPLTNESSTFKKWMWIEGLLKTLKENKKPVQSIYFLVHHKTLIDDQLDFTNSWPIEGFLTEEQT